MIPASPSDNGPHRFGGGRSGTVGVLEDHRARAWEPDQSNRPLMLDQSLASLATPPQSATLSLVMTE